MKNRFKQLTDFLVQQGLEAIGHSNKSYLAHLIGVYRSLEDAGYSEEVACAGMFHSIYGTESFRGFALPLERRPEIRELIGERAERLAYLNCAMVRASFDRAVETGQPPYRIKDRLTGDLVELSPADFDDLCRVHLYDWLEQVARSEKWDYRRDSFRRMGARLDRAAQDAHQRIYSQEPAQTTE